MKKQILLLIIAALSVIGMAQNPEEPLVPVNFDIPMAFHQDQFTIRLFTETDRIEDYHQVMSKFDYFQQVFPVWSWPGDYTQADQDLAEMEWLHQERWERSSFTYAILCADTKEPIGNLYIYPATKDPFDAEIYLWFTANALNEGLDTILFKQVKAWMTNAWPFENPAYPGREISLNEWKQTD